MGSSFPTTLDLGAFLVTYAVHSTLLLAGVALAVRWLRPPWPELRELLWKAALVGGVVTSLAATWLPVRHCGWEVCLAVGPTDGATPRAIEPVIATFAIAPKESALESFAAMSPPSPGPRTGVGASGQATELAASEDAALGSMLWTALVGFWLLGCGLGACRLTWQWLQLRSFERRGRKLSAGPLVERTQALARRLGARRRVEVYLSPLGGGPMAAGLLRWRLYLPARFLRRLDAEERDALLAHELAHLVRGDPWWILLGQLTCLVFFFQPLNYLARRQLRTEAEYLADRRAAGVLADGLPLARCLMELAQWLLAGRRSSPHPVAASMMPYRSTLGRRVEQLLREQRPTVLHGRWHQEFCRIGLILALTLTLIGAPRALAERQSDRGRPEGDPPMKQFENLKSVAWSLAIALGLTVPAVADETKPDGDKKPAAKKPVPDGQKKESADRKKPVAEEKRDTGKRKGVGERDPDLSGKITAVAADGKRFTLEVPSRKDGGKSTPVTIYVNDQTKFAPAREDAPKLAVGQSAMVWLAKGSEDIAAGVAIRAGGERRDTGIKGKAERKPDLFGKILAISDDGRTVTVAVPSKEDKFKETTIKLTDLTKVQSTSDEGAAKPAVGNLITVWLREGSQDIAIRIRLAAPDRARDSGKKKSKEGADRRPDLTGKVTAVSDDGKQLTLELPRKNKGAEAATLTVHLTDKTKVAYIGVDKDAQKPAVGQLAQVQFVEGSKDAAARVTLAVKKVKDGDKKPAPDKKKETKKPAEAK